MKKASLLAITGLFPFVVFSQPSDLLNNFLNETKQASGAFEQQTFQKDGKPAEELQEPFLRVLPLSYLELSPTKKIGMRHNPSKKTDISGSR